MKKNKSIAKLVEDVAVLMQKYVRLKAADENGYCQCVTCGKVGHWKELQGGHYIPRGNQSTKILEENIHPQCVHCNHFDKENAKIAYTRWMDNYYGVEFVRELEILATKPRKYYRDEVDEIKQDLLEKIRELENESQ